MLLACTSRWFPASRLAMALTGAGFTVEATCPSSHSLAKLRCVQRTYTHYGFFPAESFLEAIRASKPDLIVPCDDVAVRHLHQLYARAVDRPPYGSIAALIERSLGSPESFRNVYRRAAFLRIAKEEGVRVPLTRSLTSMSDLEEWGEATGNTFVLKADNTSGGDGVRIVRNHAETSRAFKSLSAPPLMARAFKRSLIDQDSSLVAPSLFRRRAALSAQSFVRGREATSAVACWKGTVLAELHFEVINKTIPTGHSTVLRLIENAEMSAATKKVVRRLGLSGVNGFDFMLEADTGNPYMVEINPRATQVGHLTLGPGLDIPAALFSAVTGSPIQEAPKLTDNRVVALFPQEWKRDASSAYLRSGYHDVPWEEADLIRACVRDRRRQWASWTEQEAHRMFSPARIPRP